MAYSSPSDMTGRSLISRWAGPVWFVLAILAALPVFWFGLTGLVGEWARPEYSHGPVIPILSFYMFLREMKDMPPSPHPIPDRGPGIAVIVAGLALAMLGNLTQISDLVFYALIIWIGGLILTAFGARRGWYFWPSVLHLVFMLPLPQFLYWKVSTALQLVSSSIGVWLVQKAGVPVFLEGNIIDLGIYKLQVAEACSGLRYLFPIMSFTYVFAVLYRGAIWHKLVLLLSAVPIAVLMNSVRIGIIGLLVDRYGIEQAEGFLHVFEGWVIFLACIALLFLMAKLMQRLSGDRRALGEALEMDFTGLPAQLARFRAIPATRALVTVTLLTATLSAAWSLAPARNSAIPPRDAFNLYPMQIGGWSGRRAELSSAMERTLGADDYLSAFYRKPDAAAGVDLFLSYYHSQTEGEAIHSPEVCLPSAGWEVYQIAPTPITLPGGAHFTVMRAIIQQGLNQQLVYYWFEGRGKRLTGAFATKFATMADGIRLGRSDGGLVRIITPIAGGEDVADAEARLQGFLDLHIDRLSRYIPQ